MGHKRFEPSLGIHQNHASSRTCLICSRTPIPGLSCRLQALLSECCVLSRTGKTTCAVVGWRGSIVGRECGT